MYLNNYRLSREWGAYRDYQKESKIYGNRCREELRADIEHYRGSTQVLQAISSTNNKIIVSSCERSQ